ncbi:MAG: methyltransferase [Cyclobacteriaceae bacterium]|nr:methyltransferase [Cyclobacteriaceae bacterium]
MFQFKQFSIEDDRCAMKVGTDAVLLGAWVDVSKAKKILDVGTGCGIIALMLAQRTERDVWIEGIEIEEQDAIQAAENSSLSPWKNRIKVTHQSLQEFKDIESFDLIVSNPPYFINSQLPPSTDRANARHTQTLSYQELIDHSIRLLNKDGRLAVVLPYAEGKNFVNLASLSGLICIRQLAFYSREGKPQERWLFEFSLIHARLKNEKLVLHGAGESWSPDYQSLTKAFYLKL